MRELRKDLKNKSSTQIKNCQLSLNPEKIGISNTLLICELIGLLGKASEFSLVVRLKGGVLVVEKTFVVLLKLLLCSGYNGAPKNCHMYTKTTILFTKANCLRAPHNT